LVFDKKCTDDAGLDAVATSRASVWSVYGLLPLGDGGVLAGTESGDTRQSDSTVTAFRCGTALLQMVIHEIATGSFDHSSAVRLGVVGLALAESDSLGHFILRLWA